MSVDNIKVYRIAALVALPIALIAFIPSMVGLVLIGHESKNRTAANRDLIQRLAETQNDLLTVRKANLKLARKADVGLCQDLEDVKGQIRAIVRFNPVETIKTLKLLNIDPESQRGKDILTASKAAADDALRKLAPRHGGCASLPRPKENVP